MAAVLANPVPDERTRNAPRSHASVVPVSGMRDADLAALRAYTRELQAGIEDILARHAGNQKTQMHTL